MKSIKPLLTVVFFIACEFCAIHSAFAQMFTVPLPDPSAIIEQRKQRLAYIKQQVFHIQNFIAEAGPKATAANKLLEQNNSNILATFNSIRRIELNIYELQQYYAQTNTALNAACYSYMLNNGFCPPGVSNPYVSALHKTNRSISVYLSNRQTLIFQHQRLLSDFYLTIDYLEPLVQNLRSAQQALTQYNKEISEISALPLEVPGFDFSKPEPSIAKPSVTSNPLLAEADPLKKSTETILDSVSKALADASAAQSKAASVISSAKGSLDLVKKSLKGTPANELDFGDV